MTPKLKKLIAEHPDLAKSIVTGAMDRVRDVLDGTDDDGVIQDEWGDGFDRSWKGSHVTELCQLIAAEIERRCGTIVTSKE